MVRIDIEARGDALEELLLYFLLILALGQPGADGDPIELCVHRHRGFAEGDVEHQVWGLAALARLGLQRSGARHLAAMQVYQHVAGLKQVPGLVDTEVDGLCAQQHGGEQLEHRGVLKLRHRRRVGRLQRGKKGLRAGMGS